MEMLRVGNTYNVTIVRIGKRGDGICFIEGIAIIVPNTKKGDKIRIKVTSIKKSYAFAEIVENSENEDISIR